MYICSGTERDYVQWLAHSAYPSGSNDGCVLGYKETFFRLRKDSVCWNGRDYSVSKKLSPCPCTVDDYHWYVLVPSISYLEVLCKMVKYQDSPFSSRIWGEQELNLLKGHL